LQFGVRLTPRGGRDAIDGWASDSAGEPHLKVRVRAVPEDGKANAALLALLARELATAKSAVALVSGDKARLKTIRVTGDTARLAARLEAFGEA
jgi:uncharacterized protein YggU (UPF0235/DUF167 family)